MASHQQAGTPGTGRRPGLRVQRHPADAAAVAAITTLMAGLGIAVQAGSIRSIERGDRVLTLGAELRAEPKGIVGWFGFVMLAGLLLPAGLLLRWWNDRVVRRMLGPYLAVLLVHIGSEAMLRRLFFTNISLFIGVLYSPYRCWQAVRLAGSQADDAPISSRRHTAVRSVLRFEAAVWLINLLVLLAGKLPRVLVRGGGGRT